MALEPRKGPYLDTGGMVSKGSLEARASRGRLDHSLQVWPGLQALPFLAF